MNDPLSTRTTNGIRGAITRDQIWQQGYAAGRAAAIPPGAVLVTEELLGQLRAERDFLAERALWAGRAPFTSERFVGVSSNALVRSALGGESPSEDEYPRDEADLAACRRTLEMAPPHLREVMSADLDRYVAALRATP